MLGILLAFLLLTNLVSCVGHVVRRKLDHHSHHHSLDSKWDCERPWPTIDLFLPFKVYSDTRDPRYYELEQVFLMSWMMFWPLKLSNTSLILAYDGEEEHSAYITMIKETLSAMVNWRVPGGVKLIGIPPSKYYTNGYNRQQYNMFWADNFTTAEFVGFVDSDAAIITYVDREDLFEDGKPVINGRSGLYTPYDVASWVKGDAEITGILEPMKCMSYFPVIIKRIHLREIRDFVGRHWNTSFDQAFLDHVENPFHVSDPGKVAYSQFGIMCTYLWTFHRDEYTWYVHSETPDWDGVNPPPVPGQDGNLTQFTEQMKLPKPRIATHAKWRTTKMHVMPKITPTYAHEAEYKALLRKGYCYSPPFPKTEAACADVNPLVYWDEMHNFDRVSYEDVNSKEAMDYQAKLRHSRLKNCSREWYENDLRYIQVL